MEEENVVSVMSVDSTSRHEAVSCARVFELRNRSFWQESDHHHHHLHRPESYRAEFGSCTLSPQDPSAGSLPFEFQLPGLDDTLTFHSRSHSHEDTPGGKNVEAVAPPSFESSIGGENREKTEEKDSKGESAHFVEWVVEASYSSGQEKTDTQLGEEEKARVARASFSFIPSEIPVKADTKQDDMTREGTKVNLFLAF